MPSHCKHRTAEVAAAKEALAHTHIEGGHELRFRHPLHDGRHDRLRLVLAGRGDCLTQRDRLVNAWAGASGFVVVTVRAWTAEGRRIGSWEGGCKRKQPQEEERDGLHHARLGRTTQGCRNIGLQSHQRRENPKARKPTVPLLYGRLRGGGVGARGDGRPPPCGLPSTNRCAVGLPDVYHSLLMSYNARAQAQQHSRQTDSFNWDTNPHIGQHDTNSHKSSGFRSTRTRDGK